MLILPFCDAKNWNPAKLVWLWNSLLSKRNDEFAFEEGDKIVRGIM